VTFAELKVDLVVLACAVSAGIHAGLVPEHLREAPAAGVGFAVSSAALLAAAVALTRDPSRRALLATAVLLGALIAAYALAVATGIPLVHPGREGVEALALVAKGVEAAGLVLAATLLRRPSLHLLHPKGTPA
jgi:hypothetical protein